MMDQHTTEAEILYVGLQSNMSDNVYDITGATVEIHIYEALDSISISGSVVILDTHNMYSALKLSGGERVTVKFSLSGVVHEKEFITYAVESMTLDDRGGAVNLKVIDVHQFANEVGNAGGTYSDNCAVIIAKILKNSGISSTIKDLSKQARTLCIPNTTPFNAIKDILQQISSASGNKMFVYSTFNGGITIDSLERLFGGKRYGGKYLYNINEYPTNPNDINEVLSIKARTIDYVEVDDNIERITMVRDGILGIRNNIIDMHNKTITTNDHKPRNATLDMNNTKRINTVMNSSVSSLGWDRAADQYKRINRMSPYSLRGMVIPSYNFRGMDALGKTINVVFPKSAQIAVGDDPTDKRRSGDYIIVNSHLNIKPGNAHFVFNALYKVNSDV